LRIVIGTNVLVSAVTDRDPRQRARAEALFRSAAEGETTLLIPQCVLFELLFVLRNLYGQDDRTIRGLLADLSSMPGVAIVEQLALREWLRLWPEEVGDAADAAVAAVALETKSRVATFDRRFMRRLSRLAVQMWGNRE
jgi:predicted nucleic acid-binding protein